MEFSGLLDVDGLFKWNDIFTPAVQQPWQIGRFSNPTCSCPTAHRVQQPWQIGRFSNLWVQIPRLNRDYLFQRTAKSARSSCFCDPPGRFFDRALGSPQAYIPALTAVWIHYSKSASECEFGVLTSVLLCCSVGNEYQKRC